MSVIAEDIITILITYFPQTTVSLLVAIIIEGLITIMASKK